LRSRKVLSVDRRWVEQGVGVVLELRRRTDGRWGRRWRTLRFASGETYTTRLLPGFKLLVDPHR
jgi:hypothetical protein